MIFLTSHTYTSKVLHSATAISQATNFLSFSQILSLSFSLDRTNKTAWTPSILLIRNLPQVTQGEAKWWKQNHSPCQSGILSMSYHMWLFFFFYFLVVLCPPSPIHPTVSKASLNQTSAWNRHSHIGYCVSVLHRYPKTHLGTSKQGWYNNSRLKDMLVLLRIDLVIQVLFVIFCP